MTESMIVYMLVMFVMLITFIAFVHFAYETGHKDGFEEGYRHAQKNPVNPVNPV